MATAQQTARRSRPTKAPPRARLEARVAPHVKELLERAAALEGRSLSDFVVQSARAAALATIERHVVKIRLTPEETARFFEIMENPPEPNEYMRESLRLSRALIQDE